MVLLAAPAIEAVQGAEVEQGAVLGGAMEVTTAAGEAMKATSPLAPLPPATTATHRAETAIMVLAVEEPATVQAPLPPRGWGLAATHLQGAAGIRPLVEPPREPPTLVRQESIQIQPQVPTVVAQTIIVVLEVARSPLDQSQPPTTAMDRLRQGVEVVVVWVGVGVAVVCMDECQTEVLKLVVTGRPQVQVGPVGMIRAEPMGPVALPLMEPASPARWVVSEHLAVVPPGGFHLECLPPPRGDFPLQVAATVRGPELPRNSAAGVRPLAGGRHLPAIDGTMNCKSPGTLMIVTRNTHSQTN